MDLKDFISRLDRAGDLLRIKRRFSTRHEIAAILESVDKSSGKAVLFERVQSHRTPVVGNLLSRRRRVALALGVGEDSVVKEYSRRLKRRIRPRVVSHGPAFDSIVRGKVDILKEIPVLIHREKDAGPYFSSAVTMAKDPETGVTGMGIYRIQVRGPGTISLNFQNPPLTDFVRKAEAMGRGLEIAVVVGMDPLTFLGSVSPVPPGVDRFESAGGLRGKAVELRRCETVDVLVPADAEFVLEGRIKPGVRVHEGPFGESWGTYQVGRNPVARITAIARRKTPIYHALMPFSGEEPTLLGIITEATLLESLRAEHRGIISIVCDPFNRSNLIVCMRKTDDGEPRKVLEHVLTHAPIVKTAVAVDEDIDPNDPYAVGFAISTRFQPARGTLVLDDCRSTSLDPSADSRDAGRVTSKLGIDATRPLSTPKRKFEMVRVPGKAKGKIATFLK